ncbi:MAG: hypothetical protein JSR27_13175 [Proteobacteria bacterium]|nr:hypothetical protein [Pseudomonadota bacterium]
MSGELVPLNEVASVLLNEGRRRRLSLTAIFVVFALLTLLVGAMWPKKYVSSTTILVQESNIITPLMEGRAAATGVADRAAIAREVIFSRKVMDEIMDTGGWTAKHPSPIEKDQIIEAIKNRTVISSPRDNLIKITYADGDAKRSFDVTRRLAELFIQESFQSKERESRDAFEFINSQVEAYRKKLTDAETKLKNYRDANADARPGSETDTNARIGQLRSQIETARMDLMEQRSREASIQSQLSGQSEITAVQTTEGIYRAQLAELQSKLDQLLLTYTPEYPDVVRTRHQMDDLERQLKQSEQKKQAAQLAGTPTTIDSNVQFNPLYQQLKSKLAEVRSEAAATGARMEASESMLQSELERSKRIASSENSLAELTRDYDVNRDVYQDLLKRRENARVSMNLDEERRGLTFRIQDPAVMPLTPSGIRFMHIGIVGLLLAVAVPLGLLFALSRFDPRVRSAAQLERMTGLPVLATIPVYASPRDRRRERARTVFAMLMIVAVAIAYLALFLLRLNKVL